MLFVIIYDSVVPGRGDVMLVYHPDYRAWWGEAGQKNINRKWANIFMFYKSIGAVNTFCVILLTHEAQIVLTIAMKYLCDIGHGQWQRDNVTSGLIITHPGTLLTKNIFLPKYLISQQIFGTTIQYWVSTLSLLLPILMLGTMSLTNQNCRYLGPDPILMTVING